MDMVLDSEDDESEHGPSGTSAAVVMPQRAPESAPVVSAARAPRAGGTVTRRAGSVGPSAPRREGRLTHIHVPASRRTRTTIPDRGQVPRVDQADTASATHISIATVVRHRKSWQEPSRSTRPPAHVISHTLADGFMDAPKTRLQQLMKERYEGNLETRTLFPHSGTRDQLLEGAEARMVGGARSEGRSDALSSTWKGFLAWSGIYDSDSQLTLEWRVICYIESKLASNAPAHLTKAEKMALGYIENSTASKYIKNLKQSIYKQGSCLDEATLAEYKSSVERQGMKPDQAPPATLDDVIKALEFLAESEWVGLCLAWLCAARIGEMQWLTRSSIVILDEEAGLLSVTFPRSKSDPFQYGTTMVTYCGGWTKRIMAYLHRLAPSARVTELTTERVDAVLKRVNQIYSAHSIKRGALTMLLRANVPLSIIQQIAKHRDLEMTYLYLPQTEVALHLGLHEASRMLGPPRTA